VVDSRIQVLSKQIGNLPFTPPAPYDRTRPMIASRLDDTAPASGRTIQGFGLTCIGMARSLRGDL
jgi:hypothetical protein